MKRVTMRDIANVAGVSVMTVSYALRGNPRIPPDTTARIRKVADDLGYQSHPLVSAFVSAVRHGRTTKSPTTIALLSMSSTSVRNRMNSLHYQGALARCSDLGFKLELVEPALSGLSGPRLTNVLRYNNYAGILVEMMPVAGMSIDIDWSHFPVVALGHTLHAPGIDRVAINHIQGMLLAFDRLQQLGYRKVALGTFHSSSTRIRGRYIAAAAIHNQNRPKSRQHPVLLASDTNFTKELFLQWLDKHRPDAFIDAGQQRFGKMLKAAGIAIPREIAYATSYWNPHQRTIAGVDQCPAQLAAAGIDLLVKKIYANERGCLPQQRTMLIDPLWQDAPSAPVRTEPLSRQSKNL